MKRKSRAKSTTFWFSIISFLIIGYITVEKEQWANNIAMALVAIPLAYVAGNKATDFKHGPEMEEKKE